jgi:plasmid stabilization system protein ParE
MKNIRFLADARHELLAEALYYNEAEPGRGVEFANAVEQVLAFAAQFPLAGSPGPGGTRKVIVRGYPLTVVYLNEANGILVGAIAHHARRPGYWMDRI